MNGFEKGFREEREKIAKSWKREEKLVRETGPAAGALLGALIGGMKGIKKGKIPRRMLAGMGIGATIGWLPDIGLGAVEVTKSYAKKRRARRKR